MKRVRDIEHMVQDLRHPVDAQAHDRIVGRLLDALKRQQTQAAVRQPHTGRIIMKSPMTKLAIAAAIIAAVVLGLFEFVSTDTGSGVVWAEVARKVEASPGVIFRIRETGKGDPNEQWPNGYRVIQRNATLSRLDWYRGDEIHRTVYFDLDGKIEIWVAHDASVYSKQTMSDEKIQEMRAGGLGWTDPQGLISRGLNRERHTLGQKMIDGVLCEGIETNDVGDEVFKFAVKSFSARLWASVETGYPMLLEVEVIGGDDGSIHHTLTLDQFQWNADLSPEDVEPEIPADYRPLE